jgi:hypothetical protein
MIRCWHLPAEGDEVVDVISQLQDAIRQSGRSLRDLARETDVGADRLSRFMRGQRKLTLPGVAKLCEVLGRKLQSQREKMK